MTPPVIGILVLFVLVFAFVAWNYWNKGGCKIDADCKAPNACKDGKCVSPPPASACTPAQLAKLQMQPDNPPGACVQSADGKWLTFPNAWYASPGPDELRQITGSPRYLPPADCRAFCAADPTCTTWVYSPFDQGCYAFSTAPTAIKGDSYYVVNVSAAALGP